MKEFVPLISNSCHEMEVALLDLINPRSCGADGQALKEWFLDWMFSRTLSQVHFLIEAATPLLILNPVIADNIKQAIKDIIEFTKHDVVLIAEQAPNPESKHESDNEAKKEEQNKQAESEEL